MIGQHGLKNPSETKAIARHEILCTVMEPGLALDLDATTMTFNGEHAYVNMSKLVLMKGMVGMMLAAMLSATLSNVSGILNVYANVYTYDIWGHKEKNRQADEKKRIMYMICLKEVLKLFRKLKVNVMRL